MSHSLISRVARGPDGDPFCAGVFLMRLICSRAAVQPCRHCRGLYLGKVSAYCELPVLKIDHAASQPKLHEWAQTISVRLLRGEQPQSYELSLSSFWCPFNVLVKKTKLTQVDQGPTSLVLG